MDPSFAPQRNVWIPYGLDVSSTVFVPSKPLVNAGNLDTDVTGGV
jgi:hypothetical protein